MITQQDQLTPEKAFEVIISAVRLLKLSFDEHLYLEQCRNVIGQALVQNAEQEVPKNVVKMDKYQEKLAKAIKDGGENN